MMFQLSISVASHGGNAGSGNMDPGNDGAAVGNDVVEARLCSAFGTEAINWDSCVVMSEAAAVPAAGATAADWAAAADGFVVAAAR